MRVCRLQGGGRGVTLQVTQTITANTVVDVICRGLVHSMDSLDDYDAATLSKTKAERILRDELAFGGYEAYGHEWDGNTSGDADDFYDRVKARVFEIWPELAT